MVAVLLGIKDLSNLDTVAAPEANWRDHLIAAIILVVVLQVMPKEATAVASAYALQAPKRFKRRCRMPFRPNRLVRSIKGEQRKSSKGSQAVRWRAPDVSFDRFDRTGIHRFYSEFLCQLATGNYQESRLSTNHGSGRISSASSRTTLFATEWLSPSRTLADWSSQELLVQIRQAIIR